MPPLLKEIEFWKKKTWNRPFFCKSNTKILHSILIEHSNARNNSNSWRKLPFRVFFPRKSLAAWCLKARKNSLYFGHLEKDYLCSHDLKIIIPLKIVRVTLYVTLQLVLEQFIDYWNTACFMKLKIMFIFAIWHSETHSLFP